MSVECKYSTENIISEYTFEENKLILYLDEGKADGGFLYPDKLFDMYFSTGEYCSLTLEKV